MKTISVEPGTKILTVLQHLNYEPWFALAEYVDNSYQSYLSNKSRLATDSVEVTISICRESREITITDNAAGISDGDLQRACRAADVPPNRDGLHEFGMGMKSASFWFVEKRWTLRSSAIGEAHSKTVTFDLDKIVEEKQDSVSVVEHPDSKENHWTELSLKDVRTTCQGQTLAKIRSHLTDIYRHALLEGQLVIKIGEIGKEKTLRPEPHNSLKEVRWKNGRKDKEWSQGEVRWEKNIELQLDSGKHVYGKAGVYGVKHHCGVTLYRRGRAVIGTGDTKYRPVGIYGEEGNTYQAQRLWVELHIEGFEVSHTKDGIKWETEEQEELENKLKKCLTQGPLDLIAQSRGYRAKGEKAEKAKSKADKKKEKEVLDTSSESATDTIVTTIESSPDVESMDKDESNPSLSIKKKDIESQQTRNIQVEDRNWTIEFTVTKKSSPYIFMIENELGDPDNTTLHVTVFLGCNFLSSQVRHDIEDSISPVLSLIGGLAVAEAEGAIRSIPSAGFVRRHLNKGLNQ